MKTWELRRNGKAVGYVRAASRAQAVALAQRAANRSGVSLGLMPNPTRIPRAGEIWRGIRGDRCRILSVSGRRVQVLQLDTGHRVTSDLADFLASYKPPLGAAPNPKPKGRNPRGEYHRRLPPVGSYWHRNSYPQHIARVASTERASGGMPPMVNMDVVTGRGDVMGVSRIPVNVHASEYSPLPADSPYRKTLPNPSRSSRARASRKTYRVLQRRIGARVARAGVKATRRAARPGGAAQTLYYLQHHDARSARRKAGLTPNRRRRGTGGKTMTRKVRRAVASGRFVKARHHAAASVARGVRRLDLQRRLTFRPFGARGGIHGRPNPNPKGRNNDIARAFREGRITADEMIAAVQDPAKLNRLRVKFGGRIVRVRRSQQAVVHLPPTWMWVGQGYGPGRALWSARDTRWPANVPDLVSTSRRDVIRQVKEIEKHGPKTNPKGRKTLSVFDKHRLAIARSTLRMSDSGARIMGGMTKDEARAVILELTGRAPIENRRSRHPVRRKVRARKARPNPRDSGLEAGRRTFRRLNEIEPGRVTRTRGARNAPRVAVKLGELVSLVYESDKYTGKKALYEHKTKRPRPVLATDPGAREVHIVGGRMHPTPDGLVN